MSFEQNFRRIAAEQKVPQPPGPGANYILTRRVGDLLYVSGQAPFIGNDVPSQYKGKLGGNVSDEIGVEAARVTAINLLYNVSDALGTLDNVDYIINLEGLVQCTDTYTNQTAIIDGASILMKDVFGDGAGAHTRAASGHNALAIGICVEITLLVKVKSDRTIK